LPAMRLFVYCRPFGGFDGEPEMAEAEPSKRLSRDECLTKAQECRDMARSNQNPTHRTMLEQMAEAWERMASPDPGR
jgi:hypothetical protein